MSVFEEQQTRESIGEMLTVREVAALLHVHTNTLRRWSDLGIIRAYRINTRGDRRYAREDITYFMLQLNASVRKDGGLTVNELTEVLNQRMPTPAYATLGFGRP